MIAERMIRSDLDVCGFAVSILFEECKQSFAVRTGAVVRCDEQDRTFSDGWSQGEEIPLFTMVEDFSTQSRCGCAGKGKQIRRIHPGGELLDCFVAIFGFQA